MDNNNQFVLLKKRKFLPLFITQFLGAFNDNVFKNAIIILITFESTRITTIDPQIIVNICAGLFILPFFLFSALSGQLADKYEKSFLIRLTKILEIAIMILVFIGLINLNLWYLLSALFLLGAQSAFFGPLKYSILPQHLNENEILGGNGLIEAGTFLSILIGTMVGGILVVYNNLGPTYVSFLCLTVALIGYAVSCYIPVAKATNEKLIINWNLFTQTYSCIKLIRKNPLMLLTILGISWFWFYGATFLTQIPAFTKLHLGGNEQVTTTILTLFSVGIGVGSVLCEKISNHKIEVGLITVGAIGLSLFAFDLYLVTSLNFSTVAENIVGIKEFINKDGSFRVFFDILMIGGFGGVYCVPLYTLMQVRAQPSMRSQIVGTNNIINAIFMVAAALIAVLLLSIGFRVSEIFLFTALINSLVAFFIYQKSPNYLNHLLAKLLFWKKH